MRAFSITLLFVYLISLTEVKQFVKLPALAEHFIEHKQKNTGLTLWEFLCMHYVMPDNADNDQEKDRELPFKSHDNCTNFITLAFVHNNEITLPKKHILNCNRKFRVFSDNFINTAFLSSIWQPPKSC